MCLRVKRCIFGRINKGLFLALCWRMGWRVSFDFFCREVAVFSGVERGVECDVANADPMQGAHVVSYGVKHALHLVVAAFVDGE